MIKEPFVWHNLRLFACYYTFRKFKLQYCSCIHLDINCAITINHHHKRQLNLTIHFRSHRLFQKSNTVLCTHQWFWHLQIEYNLNSQQCYRWNYLYPRKTVAYSSCGYSLSNTWCIQKGANWSKTDENILNLRCSGQSSLQETDLAAIKDGEVGIFYSFLLC